MVSLERSSFLAGGGSGDGGGHHHGGGRRGGGNAELFFKLLDEFGQFQDGHVGNELYNLFFGNGHVYAP